VFLHSFSESSFRSRTLLQATLVLSLVYLSRNPSCKLTDLQRYTDHFGSGLQLPGGVYGSVTSVTTVSDVTKPRHSVKANSSDETETSQHSTASRRSTPGRRRAADRRVNRLRAAGIVRLSSEQHCHPPTAVRACSPIEAAGRRQSAAVSAGCRLLSREQWSLRPAAAAAAAAAACGSSRAISHAAICCCRRGYCCNLVGATFSSVL